MANFGNTAIVTLAYAYIAYEIIIIRTL